jgi:hypothetical protein
MIKLLVVAATIIAGFSCKKSGIADFVTIDYLSFGKAYGYCAGDCAKFFKLEGEKIYPDTITRYTGQAIGFNINPLSNDKYLLAKELKDNFPSYLFNRPGETIGCPDCADQGGIHLEIKDNGVSKFWHIDMDINKQPVEIRPYLEKVLAILSQL